MTDSSAEVNSTPQSPIADTSYRNYDGPLRPHRFRWWIIARTTAGVALRRKGFWFLAVMALLPYLGSGFQLYLRSQAPQGIAQFLGDRPLTSLFYEAFAMSQLWICLLCLMVGSGSIAGDNRTNALQIYLARPITKGDYLGGKWAGVFLVLAAAAVIPNLILYLYCLGSLGDQQSFKDHPYLLVQAVGCGLIPATLHSSIVVGISAWFKRPVLVGGLYAGLYFGSGILSTIAALIVRRSGNAEHVATVFHLGVERIFQGLAQHIYDVLPTMFGARMRGPQEKPDLMIILALAVALGTIGLLAARMRVRAVEVVKG